MLYFPHMKEYDFLAVGDITTDAFIELKDAEVNCDIDKDNCRISMRFGDKIPYRDVTLVPAVGNSPNAAVSAARLGLSSALVSDIGNDSFGKEDVDTLKKNGVATEFVRTHPGMKSNYHFVLLFNAERTILVKHREYPYSFPDVPAPKWMYLSSLGEHSLPYHEEIAQYLRNNPSVKLAFQPGTFQIKIGYEPLGDIYARTEIFFCNKEEARRILKNENGGIKDLLSGVRALGPKIAVITDGPKGAYADDGTDMWHMPMYPDPAPPVDRTGAGDSFASTVTAALALGKDLPEALSWGPVNSMSVVQHIGAQEGLLSREELERLLSGAPDNFRPSRIA